MNMKLEQRGDLSLEASEQPRDIRGGTASGGGATTLTGAVGFLWLLAFVLIGAALRFYLLGTKSLWLVEAFSVFVARQPWHTFLRTLWWGEANMSLFYFLLKGWIRLGDSELWLRSLSALFGIAAIPAVYAFGKRFVSSKVGMVAAGLLTLQSFHIQYSQELRSYSLLTFLVILSCYAFLLVLETPARKSAWLLWVIFSALAVYAHMFAVFVLISQWLVLTPARVKRLGILKLLGAAAGISFLVSPIAAVVVLQNKGQLDWVPPLTFSSVSEILQDLVGAGPAVSQDSVVAFLLIGLYGTLWIVALSSAFRARLSRSMDAETTDDATLPLLISWFVFPVAAMILISVFKPIIGPRYLLMCVPPGVLLAACGLQALEKSRPRGRMVSAAILLATVILAIMGTRNYYASFNTYGHNGRAVASYVLANQKPGDAVIFYTFSGHYVFEYYAMREQQAGTATTTPPVLFPLDLDRTSIVKRTAPFARVWLVLHQTRSTPLTDQRTADIEAALDTGFRRTIEKQFAGAGVDRGESGAIDVALYTRRE
jgi:mannosyltransferase